MPTTNPVPSQDPSDLLFNAGKLDEVVNGAANSFTDRLGVARRTVAGMNADFDAQLADAESDLNVYRADAAASASEALGYLNVIRTTSYGAYASDPATDPLGNPPTVGDEYFNTTANLLKRWNGTTWQASDINTANLAASSGSSLVGYDGGTVQDVLDGAKSLQDYAALRAYTGRASRVYITGLLGTAKTAGIAGVFQYDLTDTTSADNGGTIIVGADGRRWKRDHADGWVNVKWFGATGSGIVNDAPAIQSAINYIGSIGGGTLFFPNGAYKVTTQIDISYSRINLRGTGRRGVYAGAYSTDDDGVSTIFATPDHTGPNVFRFYSPIINYLGGFSCEDLAFGYTVYPASSTLDCFGWELGNFQYDFVFNRISIHCFKNAFVAYKTGVLTDQVAALRVRDSNINNNRFIAKTIGTTTAWNGFDFFGGNMGQQMEGGIDIKATGASIINVILEGQPNPIKIRGVNSPTVIKNNYFELSSGFANIHIEASRGDVEIGPNFHFNNTTLKVTHQVYVNNSAFIDSVDPYWSEKVYRATSVPKLKKGSVVHGMGDNGGVYTSTSRYVRVDDTDVVAGLPAPNGTIRTSINAGKRELSPFDGLAMSCAAFSTGGTSGTNNVAAAFGGTTINPGQWIVLSWLCKYDNDPIGYIPYILWTAGVLDGGQDTTLDQLSPCVNPGEFYVFTAAYRCATQVSAATVSMNFYPYGVSTTTVGLTASVSASTMYIVDSVEDIRPFVSQRALRYSSAAPTSGTWVLGDKIYNSSPSASGYEGWICTSPGTPGTWKTFGAISA